MALTDSAIKQAKAGDVDRKMADERGLYLLVTVSGSKLWRLKYRIDGKEKKLSLGSYPEVGLKEARERRDAGRKAAEAGSDPAAAKREARIARQFASCNTFGAIAEEYILKLEAEQRAAITIAKTRWLLSKLSPSLGKRPISEITPHELLAVLRASERKGHRETARRMRSFASRVFRYAVITARATVDPAQPLQGALVAPTVTHHAAIIEPMAFGGLLRAIEDYSGQPVTTLALRFSAHVFQRPGEIRQAEWREIDFDKAVWTIPATRMKQRQAHRVPLSTQAIAKHVERRDDVTGRARRHMHLAAPQEAVGHVSGVLAAATNPRDGGGRCRIGGEQIKGEAGGLKISRRNLANSLFNIGNVHAAYARYRAAEENPVDVKASNRLSRLYDALIAENPEWADADKRHAMHLFMTRIIFCMFAEDTGIFAENLFSRTLTEHGGHAGENMERALARIFMAMNTPDDNRAGQPGWATAFPYVNGGLCRAARVD